MHLPFLILLFTVTVSAEPLQERIDWAAPGDTVRVEAGIYEGNLAIGKRLALMGEAGAVIRGDGTGSTVTITADSVEVSGFTVEHCGGNLATDDSGIHIAGDHCTISRVKLRDVLFGVYFLQADYCLVSGVTIIGRSELELGERGSGVHLYDSHDNIFRNNTITAARDGFYVQNSNRTEYTGNTVTGVRYGLHYMYSDSNRFYDNTFTDNVAGAAVMYSNGITIRRNRFKHNRGFASYGILFQDCHGLEVDSNLIVDNVTGLFFEATTHSRFQHNVIAGNDIALQMFQNSPDNVITENNFVGNLNPLVIVGKRTGTIWSLAGRGNYWSGYRGYDLDGSGTGDIPMKIHNVFEYLEGRFPMVRLYLYSPASQALAAASEAFPILELNSEVDENPLMTPVELTDLGSKDGASREPANGSTLMVVGIGAVAAGGVIGVSRKRRA